MPNIQKRLDEGTGGASSDAPDPRAQAIVACALTCLDVANEAWTRSEGRADPRKLFDLAVAAVRGLAGPHYPSYQALSAIGDYGLLRRLPGVRY